MIRNGGTVTKLFLLFFFFFYYPFFSGACRLIRSRPTESDDGLSFRLPTTDPFIDFYFFFLLFVSGAMVFHGSQRSSCTNLAHWVEEIRHACPHVEQFVVLKFWIFDCLRGQTLMLTSFIFLRHSEDFPCPVADDLPGRDLRDNHLSRIQQPRDHRCLAEDPWSIWSALLLVYSYS